MIRRLLFVTLFNLITVAASAQKTGRVVPSYLATTKRLRELAVGQVLNGRLLVLELMGPIHHGTIKPYFTVSNLGPAGTRVAGFSDGQVTVLNSLLEVLWTRPAPIQNVLNLSLSPDGTRVAIVGTGREVSHGSLWVISSEGDTLKTAEFTYDEARDGSCSIGWDSSGRRLVFGVEKRVRIIDLANGASKDIAAGSEAAWSPDGSWIAYKDPNEQGHLRNVRDEKEKILGRAGRRLSGSIHWSPNSELVLVQETHARTRQRSVCAPDDVLVVYRLADNYRSEIYDTCGLRDWYFGWMLAPNVWLRSVQMNR